MEKKYLAESLIKTIESEGMSVGANLFEVGLDSIMEDGFLKDIPLVSTAVALYKMGNSLIDRHNIKKLVEFIKGFNENSFYLKNFR